MASSIPSDKSAEDIVDHATTSNAKWTGGYFFPSLADQRRMFCISVLKKEDIPTVCELGCGEGSVIQPMVNGASHKDAFPEPYHLDQEDLEGFDDDGASDDNETGTEDAFERTRVSSMASSIGEHRSVSQQPTPSSERSSQESLSAATQASEAIASTSAAAASPSIDFAPISPRPDRARRKRINRPVYDAFKQLPQPRPQDKELHLRRIAGLDIVPGLLQQAIAATAPTAEEVKRMKDEAAALAAEAASSTDRRGRSPLPGERPKSRNGATDTAANAAADVSTELDVVPHASAAAIQEQENLDFVWTPRDRWEDLRVEIWQGSLDVYNEAFDNFEAFVMTEVIEHLQEKTLAKFPDILFGSYRPRIVVITTPNYDFNTYFKQSKSSTDSGMQHKKKGRSKYADDDAPENETQNEFLDPTGRTDRVFRDADHKFEWTQAEFKEWCEGITSKYDYTVSFDGVGSLRNFYGRGGMRLPGEPDNRPAQPQWVIDLLEHCPGGDSSKFYATQCAIFRRRYAYEPERNPRSPVQSPLAFYGKLPAQGPMVQLPPGQQSPTRPVSRGRAAVNIPGATSSASRGGSSGSRGRANGNMTVPVGSTPMSSSPASTIQGSPSSVNTLLSPLSQPVQHKLLKTHTYRASRYAGDTQSYSKILAEIEDLMRNRIRMKSLSLRELWGRNQIARACGGAMNKMVEAAIEDGKSKRFDLEFKPEVLERGGNAIEDATYFVLKDFDEPKYAWGDNSEEEEEELDLSDAEAGKFEEVLTDSDDEAAERRKKVWPKKFKVGAAAPPTASAAPVPAADNSITDAAMSGLAITKPAANATSTANTDLPAFSAASQSAGAPEPIFAQGVMWPAEKDEKLPSIWDASPPKRDMALEDAIWGTTAKSSLMTDEEWAKENPSASGWD